MQQPCMNFHAKEEEKGMRISQMNTMLPKYIFVWEAKTGNNLLVSRTTCIKCLVKGIAISIPKTPTYINKQMDDI